MDLRYSLAAHLLHNGMIAFVFGKFLLRRKSCDISF